MTRQSPLTALRLTCALALAAVAGCGELPADSVTTSDPIFGGAADPGDDAVLALVHQMTRDSANACTGTTIAKVGAFGILLTAGHCVVETDANRHIIMPLKVASPDELYVVPGPDWVTSVDGGLYYVAASVTVHPQYDGKVDSPFDIAMVRYLGATAATPVIPVVTAAEDATFATGSAFTLVGFGKTESNDMNSQRRKVDRVVESLSAQQFRYDQRDLKGACDGDSGGPALVTRSGGARVVGITSYGDMACTTLGVSVRAGPMSSLIQSFISTSPAALTCAECVQAVVAPGNACVAQAVACDSPTSTCGRFLSCVGTCTTSACVTGCRQSQPAGSAAYDAMVTCQCNGACATPCRTNSACAPYLTSAPPPSCLDVTDPVPACTACLQGTCCAAAAACAADATCAACTSHATASCPTNALFGQLNACTATCTGAPCSGATSPPPDGGGKGGCGCGIAAPPSPGVLAGALASLCAALARRRRR